MEDFPNYQDEMRVIAEERQLRIAEALRKVIFFHMWLFNLFRLDNFFQFLQVLHSGKRTESRAYMI